MQNDSDMESIIKEVDQNEAYFVRLTAVDTIEYAVITEKHVLLTDLMDTQTAMQ